MIKLKVLDLFSGIGGFSLGLESTGGFETIAFCEIDPFCQKVLRKHWPDVPIIEDIREVTGERIKGIVADIEYKGCVRGRGRSYPNRERVQEGEPSGGITWSTTSRCNEIFIDLLTAGVPCQPASCAGQRRGTEDDRWLWPETVRVIREVKPTWAIFENVAGLLTLDNGLVFAGLLSQVEGEGYEVQPFIIPAVSIGAPHRRDRVWIVCHSETTERQGTSHSRPRWNGFANADSHAPDTDNTGPQEWNQYGKCAGEWAIRRGSPQHWNDHWYTVALRTCVRRVDAGLSRRMDRNRVNRLEALGNAVVPQVVEMIGRAILEAERA